MSSATSIKIVTVLLICLLFNCYLANAQAMGFESESNSIIIAGGRAANDLSYISYGNNDKFKLKKGDFLDVDGQLNRMDWNNPTVHPTLEIMKANHQVVEFVSDPIKFTLGGAGFCKVHDKFKHFLNKIYGGHADDLIHPTYKHAGMLVRAPNGRDVFRGDNPNSMIKGVSQALQVTFSFNVDKSWLAIKTIAQFLEQRKVAYQNNNQDFRPYETKSGIKVIRPAKVNFAQQHSVNGMTAMVEFLEQDNAFSAYSDYTKFFIFNIFQFLFTGGISDQCNLPAFAKSIAGAILLRTDYNDFINYGGNKGVKSQLGNNARNTILGGWKRFAEQYLKKYPNSSLKVCTQANNGEIVYFAKKYDTINDFPFTATDFLDRLFAAQNPTNLFLDNNAAVFDKAFSRFRLNENNPIVVFELRTLEGFIYNQADYTSLQEFSIFIPTLFNIGNEINTKNGNFDLGLKSCNDNKMVPYSTQLEFQVHANEYDQKVKEEREKRRAVEGAIANMRQNRRAEQNGNVLSVSNRKQRLTRNNAKNSKIRNHSHVIRMVNNKIRNKKVLKKAISNKNSRTIPQKRRNRKLGQNNGRKYSNKKPKNVKKGSNQRKNHKVNSKKPKRNIQHVRNQNSNARTLSIDPNEPISLLREERRKIRVQKRFDREERRETEVKSHTTNQTPTPEQIEREKVRLAREKKRLAREEERDVKEGVTPVTSQQLEEIAKNNQPANQPIPQQPKPSHTIRRYRTKNDDLVLEINLNVNN